MPGQEYKPKSAFSGKRLPGVDNRSTSKKNGGNEADERMWASMAPKLEFLPAHIREDGRPATEKFRALPQWFRTLIGR